MLTTMRLQEVDDMSSARHDYQQFLAWLHRPELCAAEDTRRFANLVGQNFDILAANSLSSRRHKIYFNSWATHPILEVLTAIPHAIFSGEKIQRCDGVSLAEVLGLPTCWSEEE